MRRLDKGRLFVHMMALILARAVLFGNRCMIPGVFAGACVNGVSGIGIMLASALGMAGNAGTEEIVKYLLIMAVSGILLFLVNKAGKRPGIAVTAGITGVSAAAISAGGLMFSGAGYKEVAAAGLEGLMVICSAVVANQGIRFFMEEKKNHFKAAEQVAGAAVMAALAVYALPKPGEIWFYIELTAFLCLLLMGYRQAAGEDENSYGKESFQDIAKRRLTGMADSFEKLSASFLELARPRQGLEGEELNQVMFDMSERLCSGCERCSRCWDKDLEKTWSAAGQIVAAALDKGAVVKEDVPVSFSKSCICMDEFLEETNRSLALEKLKLSWHNQVAESREAVAGQLKEVARIVSEFSGELYDTLEASGIREDTIISGMKKKNIQVKKVSVFETRNRGLEVYLYARCQKGKCVTIKEAAGVLSGILGKQLVPAGAARNVVGREYSNICFKEDTNFRVLTGVARIPKKEGEICGDNFSFLYPETGEMVMMLADGMGTGDEAAKESRYVIELLEDLLEAGFREEPAVKLINSILVMRTENDGFSTVDLGVMNLFAGTCEFIKAGAVAAYIKRGKEVEVIRAGSLPPGVTVKFDYESECRKLYDGDFVIMVTDGVTDCADEGNKEEFLKDIIAQIRSSNPQEIANTVLKEALKQNNFTPADDMTVLAAGIWKKQV